MPEHGGLGSDSEQEFYTKLGLGSHDSDSEEEFYKKNQESSSEREFYGKNRVNDILGGDETQQA